MKRRQDPGQGATAPNPPRKAKRPAPAVAPRKKPLVLLAQLPLPRPSPFARSGNAPLAAGTIAAALRRGGPECDVEVLGHEVADSGCDAAIAREIAALNPSVVGLSVYCWNSERSLDLADRLKAVSPSSAVVLGGPEVDPANALVSDASCWDFAVCGEGEEAFAALLSRILPDRGRCPIPGVWERGSPARTRARPTTGFAAAGNPYALRILRPAPGESAHLEAARGCAFSCAFCAYHRENARRRLAAPEAVAADVRSLAILGCTDAAFVDPTFNHRPDFDDLVRRIGRANRDPRISLFAELRPEGITAQRSRGLAGAGFDRVEIGLQSVNAATLRGCGRRGGRKSVAEAARALSDAGITVCADLIVGLPGDGPADVEAGAEFLRENGLAGEAQVFLLSVLPGTRFRRDAARIGLEFDPAPPYHVTRTPGLGPGDFESVFRRVEGVLGRGVDETPRPLLCDPGGDSYAVVNLDLDSGAAAPKPAQLANHVALRLAANDLWERRGAALEAVRTAIAMAPFSVLDVILRPRSTFPVDLPLLLREEISRGRRTYQSRFLAHRGIDAQRRLCACLPEGAAEDRGWVDAIRSAMPVFEDQCILKAASRAALLGAELPGARITGAGGPGFAGCWARLAAEADPDAVCFADPALEARWVREVLGW